MSSRLLASYILCSIGALLVLMAMVSYLQRMTLKKLPFEAAIVSVFLPLGPLKQGSYGCVPVLYLV